MGRLAGKVAIVTGGGSGIGRATVKRFVEEGAKVVCADIAEAAGRATVALAGEGCMFLQLDAGDPGSWRAALDETISRFGSLQVLVNNAALRSPVTIEDTDLDVWRANQRVTSEGVFLGTKLAAEVMSGKCSIVNLSSTGAFVGLPASFPYSAAKGAVRALSRSAAIHFAQQGRDIRVNVVAPGATFTEAMDRQTRRLAQQRGTTQEAVLSQLTADVPMKRMAAPVELANAILFLASDESSFITGAELIVDGGLTAV